MGRQIITVKQQQKISPKAIQSLQVLSMPIMALSKFLDDFTMENPMIELEYGKNSEEFPNQDMIDERFVKTYSNEQKDIMNSLAEGELFGGNYHESETLRGFLRLQLLMCNITKKQEKIGEEIIENINEDGYFEGDLREITYYLREDIFTGKNVLKLIQTFYPKGVGATSVAECIILQIDPEIQNYKKVIFLIENDLEDLADRKILELSRKYSLKKEELLEILAYIQTLNPRPGCEFYRKEIVNYIIPDVVIKKENSQFLIELHDNSNYAVTINEQYLHILQDKTASDSQKDYVRKKFNEAKILMQSLKMRQSTLKKIAFYLLHVQRPFFEYGAGELRPIMMKEAAKLLGLHVSTISRAVQGKYIQTPWGIFPLKYFFSSTLSKHSKKSYSPERIKIKIKEIIEKENAHQPLSDNQIMEFLNDEEGIKISRRTIAKYRQLLGIAGQSKRKLFS